MEKREMLYNENDYNQKYYLDVIKDLKEYGEPCYWEEDNEDDFYDWESTQKEQDFEDVMGNLMYSKVIKDRKCVIVGSVGTWMGNREIIPTICNNVTDAINKCVEKCELRSIERVDNHLEVSVYHHDGSNHFDLYFLSDKGEEEFWETDDVDMDNLENFIEIPEYIY